MTTEQNRTEQNRTGYPSIDRPWLKYYSEEAINAKLPECTIYEYLWENNKDHLDDIALIYFGKKITYGEMFENIDKAAAALFSLGIKQGDIISILSIHTPETVYLIYAINKIGAISNMLYLTLSSKEIVTAIRNTDSKVIFVLETVAKKVLNVINELNGCITVLLTVSESMSPLTKTIYCVKTLRKSTGLLKYNDFIKGYKKPNILYTYQENSLAVIAYTSGSTGKPKGVMLSNDNLNALVQQYKVSGMKFCRGDKFFDMLPPFVGFGISIGIHLPLSLGMKNILNIIPDPNSSAKEFIKHKPQHFVSGPVIIKNMLKKLGDDLSYITTFAGGGESLTVEQEEMLNKYLREHGFTGKYVTGYGMTEFGATVCTGMNHVYKTGTLGIPLPKVVAKIIDTDTGKELSYGEIGEIWFNAPNTMIGYFKNQKETEKIISVDSEGNRWLHTGDLGSMDEDGFLYFKGRIKRIFLTKYDDVIYKLYPSRIEELFNNNSNVQSCGVIAIKDDKKIHTAIAFVELKDNVDEGMVCAELENIADRELPIHSMPKRIIIIDKLPLTQSNKIDYQTLEKEAEKL